MVSLKGRPHPDLCSRHICSTRCVRGGGAEGPTAKHLVEGRASITSPLCIASQHFTFHICGQFCVKFSAAADGMRDDCMYVMSQ
jgi:hypothetical protein